MWGDRRRDWYSVEFLVERDANDGSVVVQFRGTWYASEYGTGVERPFRGWLMPLTTGILEALLKG